jgi:glucokinase
VKDKDSRLYLGIDVGGTKILAALVKASGAVLARRRAESPQNATPEETLLTIIRCADELLEENRVSSSSLAAIGIAIPGVVDPDKGKIIVTPNLGLSGLRIVPEMEKHYGVPVALGNDANLGTLGEKWLGAAQFSDNVIGIFVGTGIGGGLIQDGKLLRGARESAGEIGHMVVQLGGPLCGCGNRGCLEALASRSAVEKNIRAAVKAGKKTVLNRLMGKDLSLIKSSMLKKAIEKKDPLVTEVMGRAAEILGYACLTLRHIFDPEIFVLGGGVIEACGDFILPAVEKVIAKDALSGARKGGAVVRSLLGDDAVFLGAVRLAQQLLQSGKKISVKRMPDYPKITAADADRITIGGRVYKGDVYLRADGKVKKRKRSVIKKIYGKSAGTGKEELKKICKGKPETVIIGTGPAGQGHLSPEAKKFMDSRGIKYMEEATARAIYSYNKTRGRKAAVMRAGC